MHAELNYSMVFSLEYSKHEQIFYEYQPLIGLKPTKPRAKLNSSTILNIWKKYFTIYEYPPLNISPRHEVRSSGIVH